MLSYLFGTQRQFGTGLDPPEADDLDKRAYLEARSVDAANRAIELAPDNPLARFALVRAYRFSCQTERLRAEVERSLPLTPNDPTALGTWGNWLAFSGYWEQGRALAEKALALAPTSHPRWWWWVVAKDHYRKGEYEKALEAFQRSYVEEHWLSQLQMAYTLPHLGKGDEARSHLDKLIALKPQFTVREADRYYTMWCFDGDYRRRMTEALRLAGLPE
jgi:tetratricopeptide (TPR) repeat protein